jgi:hypothetical protein
LAVSTDFPRKQFKAHWLFDCPPSLFLLDTAPPQITSLPYNHRPICIVAPLKEAAMLDIILLALALGLFVVSAGYAYACDRL